MKPEAKTHRKTASHDEKLPQDKLRQATPEQTNEEKRRILIKLLNCAQKQQDALAQAVKELSELLARRTQKFEDNKTDK